MARLDDLHDEFKWDELRDLADEMLVLGDETPLSSGSSRRGDPTFSSRSFSEAYSGASTVVDSLIQQHQPAPEPIKRFYVPPTDPHYNVYIPGMSRRTSNSSRAPAPPFLGTPPKTTNANSSFSSTASNFSRASYSVSAPIHSYRRSSDPGVMRVQQQQQSHAQQARKLSDDRSGAPGSCARINPPGVGRSPYLHQSPSDSYSPRGGTEQVPLRWGEGPDAAAGGYLVQSAEQRQKQQQYLQQQQRPAAPSRLPVQGHRMISQNSLEQGVPPRPSSAGGGASTPSRHFVSPEIHC